MSFYEKEEIASKDDPLFKKIIADNPYEKLDEDDYVTVSVRFRAGDLAKLYYEHAEQYRLVYSKNSWSPETLLDPDILGYVTPEHQKENAILRRMKIRIFGRDMFLMLRPMITGQIKYLEEFNDRQAKWRGE